MILTILIIPPVALLAMSTFTEQPFQEQLKQRLQERLDSGDITQLELESIKNKFGNHKPRDFPHPPQLIIIVISLAWLGIGIRQWIVLSRWDKRYQNFKTEQKKIDEQLEDDPDEK